MWDKVEKEGAEKNVIGWGKMGQNRKGWEKVDGNGGILALDLGAVETPPITGRFHGQKW